MVVKLSRWFGILIIMALSSCSSIKVTEVKEPVREINLAILADANTNPNLSGRPSPVVVKIFQLSSDDKFKENDFFVLYDKASVLGTELVSSEEIIINPGQDYKSEIKLARETKFLAVMAAFQDVNNAVFKQIAAVSDSSVKNVEFQLQSNKVILQ